MSAGRENFAVVDASGKLWATYMYESMARTVAARCNDDKALVSDTVNRDRYIRPFRVEAVEVHP